MSFDRSDYELRAKLALGCRILAMMGHDDAIWGHMSVRDPNDPNHLWLKGHTLGLEEVQADDVVLIDFAGKTLAGTRPRHSEFPIHAEVMRRRPEINVVVHTHPTLATVLGSSGHTLRPVTHEGSYFYPPAVPIYTETSDLIITQEQGEGVATAIADHKALFMQNHGIVLATSTIEEAVVAAMLIEKAARAQIAAIGLGEVSVTSDEEALLKREHIYNENSIDRAWQYLVRREAHWDHMPK